MRRIVYLVVPVTPNTTYKLALTLLLIVIFSSKLAAQHTPDEALRDWVSLDAPPGSEYLATDVIMHAMPGWKRDALGNLILRKGSGSPRRVVACGIDRPAFAVTEITDDGYLRLRELGGAGRQHNLWVQFHEGQRIRVLMRNGEAPGVVTVKSTHLQRGRVVSPPATLDDLWVDVGATSKDDVQRLGIEMLDPVVREIPETNYGEEFVAGQLAGVRVGCAALASASRGQVTSGETIFLITTLRSFGYDGLAAALRSLGQVDQVTLLDQIADGSSSASVLQRLVEKPAFLPETTGLSAVTILAPRLRFAGTLVESVQVADALDLLSAVEKVAAVKLNRNPFRWPGLSDVSPRRKPLVDSFSGTAELLQQLADEPAVSGHESRVRDAIKNALPEWAQKLTRTDNDGNLTLEVGPDRDPIMFIAHQDEVGFEITNIAADGMVSLRTRGGMFQSLWEGQPAYLHFDQEGKTPLPGIFVPRETATAKQPEALTAWFGVDAAELKNSA